MGYLRSIIAVVSTPRAFGWWNHSFLAIARRESSAGQVQGYQDQILQELGVALSSCVLQGVGKDREGMRGIDGTKEGSCDWMNGLHVLKKFCNEGQLLGFLRILEPNIRSLVQPGLRPMIPQFGHADSESFGKPRSSYKETKGYISGYPSIFLSAFQIPKAHLRVPFTSRRNPR